MSTELVAVLIGVVGAFIVIGIVFYLLARSRKRSATSTTQINKPTLTRNRFVSRLVMWGVVVGAIALALYLLAPTMFLHTVMTLGPSIGITLMGFAVLGIGQHLTEKNETYEFVYFGWGGAGVLWILALVTLCKTLFG